MAKVTVSFVTDQEDGYTKIESDRERNRDYTGSVKSKFRYGDTAYFRVYSQAPEKVKVFSTDGNITDLGIFTEEVKGEQIPFITESTAKTNKPVKKITGYKWLGNQLGSVDMTDMFSVACTQQPDASSGAIGMASVSYQSVYRLYGLTLGIKDMDEYPVAVYVGADNG